MRKPEESCHFSALTAKGRKTNRFHQQIDQGLHSHESHDVEISFFRISVHEFSANIYSILGESFIIRYTVQDRPCFSSIYERKEVSKGHFINIRWGLVGQRKSTTPCITSLWNWNLNSYFTSNAILKWLLITEKVEARGYIEFNWFSHYHSTWRLAGKTRSSIWSCKQDCGQNVLKWTIHETIYGNLKVANLGKTRR